MSLPIGSLPASVENDQLIMWLSYVKTNVDSASAENFSFLKYLVDRTPPAHVITPSIQNIIRSIKAAADHHFYDPNLKELVLTALNSVPSVKIAKL